MGALLIAVSGCEWDVAGTITAQQPLTFNYDTSAKEMAKRAKKGKELTKVLPAGQYAAKIELEKDEMDLKAANVEVKFVLPKNIALPKNGGHVVIPAASTAQPYDIDADVKVDVTQSQETRALESCTEAVPYEDCSCSATGQVVCSNRTAYLSAQMDVSYYYVYTQRDIELKFMTAGTTTSNGQFNGVRNESEKIYTYKGACRADDREVRNIRRTERWQVRDCRPSGPPPGGPGRPDDGRPRGPRGPGGHPR